MICRKWGKILRGGIAAFLLFAMMGSSTAFAVETTGNGDTGDGDPVTSVVVEGKNPDGEEAVEEIEEGNDVLLFSRSEPVTEKEVLLYYNKTIKYEKTETHDFHVVCDGEKILAYCIEPSEIWAGKKKYKAKPYDDELMRKVLYYCYGNPGYGKMEAYLSELSLKACYEKKMGPYALCHVLLSYVYDGESEKSDAFMGCCKDTNETVKELLEAIKTWSDPPEEAEIGLSEENVKAEWNPEKKIQITPEIKVTGTEGNSVDVPVPDGATLVCGEESVTSGNRTVTVGEAFHFTAPDTVQGKYESPSLAGSMEAFQPYIMSSKKKQDHIFSISTVSQVSFSIQWDDCSEESPAASSEDETADTAKEDGGTADAEEEDGDAVETVKTDSGTTDAEKEDGTTAGVTATDTTKAETTKAETPKTDTTKADTSGKSAEVKEETQAAEEVQNAEEMPQTGDEINLLLLLAGIGVSLLFGALAIVSKTD